ncbi:serine hydrolase domain-containing protein [Microbacterium capsulatum]|uniref:Serine hydrolase domain-containing protein n=1 Tax=Microbacterium capsulatum TaxID=3041921 RepID=A0ABU0XL64_9MICO|nr:serine hydrolase domain-containing protein [Microbacterium sp. ASV81]MDQ4214860.1 serine hydrolase domain-containing protein [Microbacterium sp. ASV81]
MRSSRVLRALAVFAAAGALVLTACSPSGTPSGTPSPSAPAASTCVADPARAASATPGARTMSALPAATAAKLDAAAKRAFALGASPGAIVGVRTPQGTWITAYGSADPAAGTPMRIGMHTRIGSLTKMYTTTIVLQLAEEGKLKLDDTIGQYVPGIPNGDTITLRQLADMTSGVASYTMNERLVDAYLADPSVVYTPDQLIAAAVPLSPLFEPGTGFSYSNTNTVLLGEVIEKVTALSFGRELQLRIIDPLHLKNTSWPDGSTAIPAPYAHGYTLNGPDATPTAPTDSTSWNPAWSFTAGEIISDIDDLLTMGRALGTGQGLVDAQSQQMRLTSFSKIGYGFGMSCSNGWVGHTGDISGYNSSLYYDTATDTTVAVQTNSDIASGGCKNSPTLADDPGDAICQTPAVRLLVALSGELGTAYAPPPRS